MVRLRHYDYSGEVRFVTFSCYRRLPGLDTAYAKSIFVSCLDKARYKYGFKLLGYVVMPEHVHLVLYPPEGIELGRVIGEIKSHMARVYFSKSPVERAGSRRVFWQRRCYDHNCRTSGTVIEKINYCHNNPVERGLVDSPAGWEWSSYNWYSGQTDVPLTMDKWDREVTL